MTGQREAILGFKDRQTEKMNGRELGKVCLQTSLAPPLAGKSLSPVKEFVGLPLDRKWETFFWFCYCFVALSSKWFFSQRVIF